LVNALKARLDRSSFVVLQEMRLRVGTRVRYPDVVVVPAPVPGRTRTLGEAVVAFEVPSPDTEQKDRDTKVGEYFSLPSLILYVLVDQSRRRLTVWQREGGTPVEHELTGPRLTLPGLPDRSHQDTNFPIGLIYEDVDFAG
ncbi:MAG: Uma2 family endonuclease, partial [Acidobacteria bacterium]|nr:Uma2 family endonuclease [Acidobacteriota bacterium]